MDEREVQRTLLELLRAAVHETGSGADVGRELTPELLASAYRLARKHDVAHMVCDAVSRHGVELPRELQTQLRREKLMAVYRHEQMRYAYGEICAALDDAAIAYVPLKGAVLRAYYPEESMRTSCDIDVLIREETLEAAVKSLEAKGYLRGERAYHDVSLHSPNGVHLELHFNIRENMDRLDAVLKDAWEYAAPADGARYAFSEEFFAFHIFAHMAYHFVSGGCGIRALLDIWVMEHNMGLSYSCAEELLKRAGIYRFSAEMSGLARRCFTDGDEAAFADPTIDYIFRGGVYGSEENRIALERSGLGSPGRYALKRLFLPYRTMTALYPVLEKAPYLLPFCWAARWGNALLGGKMGKIVSEVSYLGDLSAGELGTVKEICSRLGL